MRQGAWLLAFALTAPPTWAGEVTVTVASGRITLAASTTPVSDVLDQLARKTGMKVIYDGPPPRLLVSPRVERETVTQAVVALLEGLGLSYVLITDATTVRVETLLIASGGGPSSTATPPGKGGPASPPPPPPRRAMDDDEEEETVRPMPQPPEPEPVKPSPPPPGPGPAFPTSPFASQPAFPIPQTYIPGITPPPSDTQRQPPPPQ